MNKQKLGQVLKIMGLAAAGLLILVIGVAIGYGSNEALQRLGLFSSEDENVAEIDNSDTDPEFETDETDPGEPTVTVNCETEELTIASDFFSNTGMQYDNCDWFLANTSEEFSGPDSLFYLIKSQFTLISRDRPAAVTIELTANSGPIGFTSEPTCYSGDAEVLLGNLSRLRQSNSEYSYHTNLVASSNPEFEVEKNAYLEIMAEMGEPVANPEDIDYCLPPTPNFAFELPLDCSNPVIPDCSSENSILVLGQITLAGPQLSERSLLAADSLVASFKK